MIFVSDHGDALGDHGLGQKWSMYEPVVKVPALVWAPGRFAPHRVAEKIQLFDFGPTILDLARAAQPDPCQAQNLVPALESAPFEGRVHVFCEQAGDVSMTGARLVSMVRDDRWKAVFIFGAEDGQLFDLETDPGETRNLWSDPAARDKRDRLTRAYLDWRQQSLLETMDTYAAAR